jgi:hypothetical protein
MSVEPTNLPELPYDSWKDTQATLHMWTQIVGKIRMGLSPLVNHWWNVPLYVNARGLTTSAMPYGSRTLEILFDLIDHRLIIETSEGETRELPLKPQSVAEFYQTLMKTLSQMGTPVSIWTTPCELLPELTIPFEKDEQHKSYDAQAANKFWLILVWVDAVLKEFRAKFIGKASPVHFFWGSFDLAVTRFSGRRAPARVGADKVTQEAYSHEVSSAGFWAGGNGIAGPAFYSYAAPEPAGFSDRKVNPPAAYYHPDMKEFILLYDDVRKAESPKAALMEFLQDTYDAAADLGKWDRKSLER